MGAADVFARQAELQAAQRERHDRRCSRDGCERRLARNSITTLCPACWKVSVGYTERDLTTFRDAPGPPVGMSHPLRHSTTPRRHELTIVGRCVLCGSSRTERVDQRGVTRGPAPVRRMLVNTISGIPHVTGSRCRSCEDLVRANSDRANPVLAAISEALNRKDIDASDIWAVRVIDARRRGLPDPQPPDTPWGHTTVGAPTAEPKPAPLSDRELARIRALLADR